MSNCRSGHSALPSRQSGGMGQKKLCQKKRQMQRPVPGATYPHKAVQALLRGAGEEDTLGEAGRCCRKGNCQLCLGWELGVGLQLELQSFGGTSPARPLRSPVLRREGMQLPPFGDFGCAPV